MNTSKDNLEWQIKKQIEEREIAPSRDLWSEIEWQTQNNHAPKSKMNWVLVAACLILTFSLGTVLFFLRKEPSAESPKIVKEVKPQDKAQEAVNVNTENSQLASENIKKEAVRNIVAPKNETENLTAISQPDKKNNMATTTIPEKKLELMKLSEPKILAKADSAKIPAKKKKYVDPSTLLFSVEHKDAIEKTKDGSNVATIELNRK
ncbi:hypothetical protein [Chryseobacterium sp. Mn2064]|uniref:hypothetical protein n=1 Tax=Chryseobacterium sp. Mn2064 TaxID=3395263 RepID=UPI003BD25C2C